MADSQDAWPDAPKRQAPERPAKSEKEPKKQEWWTTWCPLGTCSKKCRRFDWQETEEKVRAKLCHHLKTSPFHLIMNDHLRSQWTAHATVVPYSRWADYMEGVYDPDNGNEDRPERPTEEVPQPGPPPAKRARVAEEEGNAQQRKKEKKEKKEKKVKQEQPEPDDEVSADEGGGAAAASSDGAAYMEQVTQISADVIKQVAQSMAKQRMVPLTDGSLGSSGLPASGSSHISQASVHMALTPAGVEKAFAKGLQAITLTQQAVEKAQTVAESAARAFASVSGDLNSAMKLMRAGYDHYMASK